MNLTCFAASCVEEGGVSVTSALPYSTGTAWPKRGAISPKSERTADLSCGLLRMRGARGSIYCDGDPLGSIEPLTARTGDLSAGLAIWIEGAVGGRMAEKLLEGESDDITVGLPSLAGSPLQSAPLFGSEVHRLS